MARSLGNLGDFFPDTDIRCRVHGCNNVWKFSEAEDGTASTQDPERPERLCDECYARYRQTEDQQVACSTPGCTQTWTWTRLPQLEALARGQTAPPRGFCPACQTKLRATTDRQIPCRLKQCSRTWTWPAKEQLLSRTDTPPSRLCDECFRTLRSLQDRDVPCRLRGCTNTWLWNRFQQLEHLLSGENLDTPPKRMCDPCFKCFNECQDITVPCRMAACSRTWTYRRYEQLEQHLATGSTTPPARLCSKCYGFLQKAVDRRMPCQNRGCRNHWTFTRQMQLEAWLAGGPRNPARLCDDCQEKVKAATPVEVECMVPGCSGTWTFTPEDQVKNRCLGKDAPPPRRCAKCERFLAEHAPTTVPCTRCGAPIPWSAYEQLLCELGTFARPTTCPECAEKTLARERPQEKLEKTHHLVAKIPAAGRWQNDERISNWPPHLTYDVIARAEKADIRVVALGDDLTFSSENPETAWPFLLEASLNRALGDDLTVTVINAGIPKTTSRQALVRFPRDVAPFKPQLIIFSFLFADSLLWLNRNNRSWRPNTDPEEAAEAMETLCQKLRRTPAHVLYWTPNPAFPHDYVDTAEDRQYREWADAQQAARDHCLRQARHLCATHEIPILDLSSRFEVNGTRSAKRWMDDWYNHNATGARNIATWFSGYIRRANLLEPETTKA